MLDRKHRVLPYNSDIRTGSPGAILAKMFRTILFGLGVQESRYNALMERWSLKADNDKQLALRVGMKAELLKETITWKNFLRGVADFLGCREFTIAVVLHHTSSRLTKAERSTHRFHVKDAMAIHPGEILSGLLNVIFVDLHVHEKHYGTLMECYIDRALSHTHKRQAATFRAAISKEILNKQITWKSFIKAIVFLEVPKFTLQLFLKHNRKPVTAHETDVILDGVDLESLSSDKE